MRKFKKIIINNCKVFYYIQSHISSFFDTIQYILFQFRNTVFVHWRNIFERIINPQFLIFRFTHSMIWKYIESLKITKTADKISKFVKILWIISNAGNNYMSYPQIYMLLIQIFSKCQYTIIWLLYKLFMLFWVNMLDVKHYKICKFEQMVYLIHIFRRTIRIESYT